MTLKYIFQPELRQRLPEVIALWYSLYAERSGLSYLETLLRYVAAAGKHITLQEIIEIADANIPLGGALMSTIAEELIAQGLEKGLQQGLQQGVQQGVQQGLQQGEQKGLHTGIRIALKVKFGPASAPLLTAIAPIEDVTLLQAFADAIEHAESPDELLAWLSHKVG